jgi:hypothetical protein
MPSSPSRTSKSTASRCSSIVRQPTAAPELDPTRRSTSGRWASSSKSVGGVDAALDRDVVRRPLGERSRPRRSTRRVRPPGSARPASASRTSAGSPPRGRARARRRRSGGGESRRRL